MTRGYEIDDANKSGMAGKRKPRAKKPRESSVEAHLVKRVKELGGEVRKVRWIGRRDAPDRRAMFPRGIAILPNHLTAPPDGVIARVNFYAELKRPGEKLRPSQAREHKILRAHGEHVVVLDSREAIDRYLGFAP